MDFLPKKFPNKQDTGHYELVHTKIENQVKLKTGSLWPCLKVFTGIKKKKLKKKIFLAWRKKIFGPPKFF